MILSARVLNRTLLQRQLLIERSTRSALDVMRHLVAMQAQHPNGPYVGMHARIANFNRADLTSLIEQRQIVRSVMLRRTQHLALASDFLWLRPTVDAIVLAALKTPFFTEEISGLDLVELAQLGREVLADQVLSRRKFGALLGESYPDRLAKRLADSVEVMEGLVHPAPTASWASWGHPAETFVALGDSWIGLPMSQPRPQELVLRYLAAFGPASVLDIQTWAGITKLRAVVEEMRSQLRVYRNEAGVELFDLPDAAISDAALEAPVRFLPSFENALLGYKDRTRIISESDRLRTAKGASGGVQMYLVDGYVHGTWSLKDTTLRIHPYRRLSKTDAAAVLGEAQLLLTFITGDSGEVILEPVS